MILSEGLCPLFLKLKSLSNVRLRGTNEVNKNENNRINAMDVIRVFILQELTAKLKKTPFPSKGLKKQEEVLTFI